MAFVTTSRQFTLWVLNARYKTRTTIIIDKESKNNYYQRLHFCAEIL